MELETARPVAEAPARIFIACARCKTRKRKCNGDTPRCSNCTAHGAECSYAAVRKTRGPAKRAKTADVREEHANAPPPLLLPPPPPPCVTSPEWPGNTHPSVARTVDIFPASGKSPAGVGVGFPPFFFGGGGHQLIVPEFLRPENFMRNVEAMTAEIRRAREEGRFPPLLPLGIAQGIVEYSFEDIIPEPPFISRASLMGHLGLQYAHPVITPGAGTARWALVNSVLALAGRFKTAPGFEHCLDPITMSSYENATAVVPDLVRGAPSLLSVQALLGVALFARGIPDARMFVALVVNASVQLRALDQTRPWAGPMVSPATKEEYRRVYQFANRVSEEARSLMTGDASG
ncbi:putative glycoside hydrolase family 71 protein [Rosellinia necatrix]|uniref:Putative glycoside hydrolase family 71 protein n=1 Tax=Rosellinia necatrix TaxID=77044 RepID=A0A1W2TQW4_ROSNE|nr:putative glycoside hydrolase family 71 protein [Rosellinia necatrix]